MWKDDKGDSVREVLPNPPESGAAVQRSAAVPASLAPPAPPAPPVAPPTLDAQPPLQSTHGTVPESNFGSTNSTTSMRASASDLAASTLVDVDQQDIRQLVDTTTCLPFDDRSPVPTVFGLLPGSMALDPIWSIL